MEKVINGKLNPELGLKIRCSLDLRGTAITELPEGLKVGGDLDLEGTAITELPEGLKIGGYLDLEGAAITALPEDLEVGRYLDLKDTAITELPEDLEVGRYLYLGGTDITNYPVVYNCGDDSRAIYLDLKDKELIRIGCFIGTKDEAISRISEKYSGTAKEDYINKVIECFNMYKGMIK